MGSFFSQPKYSNEVSASSTAINDGTNTYSSTYTNVYGDENFHAMTGSGGGPLSQLFTTAGAVVGVSVFLLLVLTFWAHHRYTSKMKRQEKPSFGEGVTDRKELTNSSDYSWEASLLTEVIDISD